MFLHGFVQVIYVKELHVVQSAHENLPKFIVALIENLPFRE